MISASSYGVLKSIRSLCIPLNVSTGMRSFLVMANLLFKALSLTASTADKSIVYAESCFQSRRVLLSEEEVVLLVLAEAFLLAKLTSSDQSCTILDAVVMVSVEYNIYIGISCLDKHIVANVVDISATPPLLGQCTTQRAALSSTNVAAASGTVGTDV